MTQSPLHIHLLGQATINRDGEPLDRFRSRKAPALLFYLAHTGRPEQREALADLLWEARSTKQALSNLRTALTILRRQAADALLVTRQTLAFAGEEGHWVDTAVFQSHLTRAPGGAPLTPARAARLEKGLRLYQGDFLQGFHLSGAPRFNEWQLMEGERLHRLALTGFRRLADFYLEQANYPAGIRLTNRWLALDPLNETAHAQMMRLLAYTGQRAAALAQFEQCRRLLDEELGVAPQATLVELYEEIKAGAWETAVTPAPSHLGGTAVPRHNLPAPLTSFVGREKEVDQIVARLHDPDYRLLSIVGPGGSGKTRLAIAAARQSVDAFRDGVTFIPLADVAPADLPPALIQALPLPFAAGRPLRQQLLDWLRGQHRLLLLDNMEHLLDDATVDLLLEILAAAPEVALLVTSRQRLRAQAEDLFLLEGLPYPETAADLDAAQYDAVQLFRERARRLRKSFTLNGTNRAAVARICRLVGGMPLAIELAAAWIEQHDPPAIAAAIMETLDFLQADWRDVSPGHRSLRAVFTHSWQLLIPEEQELLARLSVFRGGFTATAAEAVAGADPAGLAGLEHKSLLAREDERYTMHMLVREFATERLAETAVADAIPAAHAAYYLGLLRERVGEAPADRALALADLEIDLENVRRAWRRAAAAGELDLINAALNPLRRFYLLRNRFQEGAEAFAAAEARLGEGGPFSDKADRIRGALLVSEGGFLNRLSRHEAAIDRADKALALATGAEGVVARAWLIRGAALHAIGRYDAAEADLARAVRAGETAGETAVIAEAALQNGRVARERGRYEEALAHLNRAHRLFSALGRPADEVTALGNLAVLAFDRGDYETAITHYEAGLAIARAIDSRYDQGRLLIGLGAAYDTSGPSEQARAYYLEAQRIARALHDPYGEMLALSNLGVTLSRFGAYEESLACYQRALAGRRKIDDRRGQAWTLLNLGLLHKHQEAYEEALACHQEALALAEETGLASCRALAWARLGQDREGLGDLDRAQTAYKQAMHLHRELGQIHWVIEARAGLARVLLAAGETAAALSHVETILDYLDENPLSGAREYFLVHWSCYQVLQAGDDERAGPFLAKTYRALRERAEAIDDPALRRAYLENVPFHRRIIAAYRAQYPAGNDGFSNT